MVYWDTFQTETRGDAKEAIESARNRMRQVLAQSLETRVVPQLVLKYDAQYESEKSITDLLKGEEKQGKGFK